MVVKNHSKDEQQQGIWPFYSRQFGRQDSEGNQNGSQVRPDYFHDNRYADGIPDSLFAGQPGTNTKGTYGRAQNSVQNGCRQSHTGKFSGELRVKYMLYTHQSCYDGMNQEGVFE
jgi:hypothetical protein